MSGSLLGLLDRFSRLRVVVLGEAMLDSYLHGSASGLCREAPVPIVNLEDRTNAPGGAANTAANVSALGAHVTFLSVLGRDEEGQLLKPSLVQHGVAIDHLIDDAERRTLTKNRVVSDSQILLRVDQGTSEPLDMQTEDLLLERLALVFPDCDALIVSDYDKGLVTPRVRRRIGELQSADPRLLLVDARDLSRYRRIRPSVVKPNYSEAVRLLRLPELGQGEDRAEQVSRAGDRLLELSGAQVAAVTLDVDGAVLLEGGHAPYRTYSRPVRNSRALGAGDTFTAAFGLALAAGAPTHEAVELASGSAAVVIKKEGTSICSAIELREELFSQDKYMPDLDQLVQLIELHRQQGRRIVFTNGCFDLLHRGHITYLVGAKALGDVLIVGVNSDESVKRLKGAGRPINRLEDRVEVLGALSCIEHIVSFEEDTPARLIEAIRPEVFVKGGDYTVESIPEAALVQRLGGQVRILPYVAGVSTTRLIQHIGEACGNNREALEPAATPGRKGERTTLP